MKIQNSVLSDVIKKRLACLPLILLHGSDSFEIDEICKEAVNLICGPNGDEELRVNKISESLLLKNTDFLLDSIKTVSFFPGRQVFIVDGVTDKINKTLSQTIQKWGSGDATIILKSGSLKVTSLIRKLTESHPNYLSVSIYEAKKTAPEIEKLIKKFNLKFVDLDVLNFLKNQNNFLSSKSFVTLLETLEIYKFKDPTPVTYEEIEMLFYESFNTTETEMLNYLAIGDLPQMLLLLKKLNNSGLRPNQIISSISRHFSLLHRISIDIRNIETALNNTYPPLFGQRRTAVIQQSKIWNTPKLERALAIISEVEQKSRLSSKVTLLTLLERSLLRIGALVKAIH
jgi:DNA polymerase-3 subunit delta